MLRWAGRAFGGLVSGLNAIGTAWIILLIVFINLDVLSLNLFDNPLPGVKEAVGISIAGIVFLQLASTLRADRHVRNDSMLNRIKRTRPRLAAGLSLFYDLTGAGLLGLIFYYCIPLFEQAYSGNYFVGTPGVFTLPTWPIYLVVLVGAAACILQYLELAYGDLRRMLGLAPPEAA